MHAIILSIGDELASGQTIDTNSGFLARQLAALGIRCQAHITVGDDLRTIVAAIRQACEELELLPSTGPESSPATAGGGGEEDPSSLLLISGGLGPTEDDLTRQALADSLNQELVEDPDAMLQIENWFKSRGRSMSASNRLQALRPHGATIIENAAGTAPGLRATRNRTEIFVMPGVPREMQEMYTKSVAPVVQQLLAKRRAEPVVTLVTKINTFGVGESVLGEKIKDLMVRGGISGTVAEKGEGGGAGAEGGGGSVSVGTTASEGVVSVRIYATGTRGQAETLTERIRATVRERLDPFIFSENEETLEAAVARILVQQKRTIATAESCTGGMLASLLTNTPGSSAYFMRGWVTYANTAKHDDLAVSESLITEHGAVSEPVARAMAEGARRFAETDFALATTGIAGPDGGTADKPVGTVWIALAAPAGTLTRRFILPGNRAMVRLRTCQMALSLLRWHMLGIPEPV